MTSARRSSQGGLRINGITPLGSAISAPTAADGRKLDAAKVKAATKFDGKWVVITNDETLTAEDVALA